MLEAALAAGIAAAGGDALLGGVLPTPAAAILVRRLGLDLAAVVSASHNPYARQRDQVLHGRRHQARRRGRGPDRGADRRARRRPSAPGRVRELNGGLEDYLRELRGGLPARPLRPHGRPRLRQRRHLPGRAGDLRAPRRRGRDDRGRARRPQHQRRLRLDPPRARSPSASPPPRPRSASPSTATATACSPSTASGRVHDGDELIALAARGMAARGELGGGVAVTVMSNYGFHQAMEEAGIEVAVTQVGDRYVLDELRARGWALGGEQSGHIIDIRLRRHRRRDRRRAADDAGAGRRRPRRRGADGEAAAGARQRRGRRPRGDRRRRRRSGRRSSARATALEGRGRVLLRPSGTEPLVRVMVEAPSAEEAEAVCERLVGIVRRELG